jgi:hypothetical protein
MRCRCRQLAHHMAESSPTTSSLHRLNFPKLRPASIALFPSYLLIDAIVFALHFATLVNMVRGRAPARGTRRGAASGGTERPATDAPAPAPTPTSTDAPAASSSETTPARRGASTRGTRAPAAGRFRPRNVRRDEAERDSLARQEEKKASERAAEERKARGRSRFRSKRSRGDTMGRGGFGRIISGASGPFSSGIGGGKSIREVPTC